MPVPYKKDANIKNYRWLLVHINLRLTRNINQIHNEFNWQKSFYDHIIRNDKSLHRIRKYVHYNPLKWEYDQENQNEIPLKQKKEFWKEFLKDT